MFKFDHLPGGGDLKMLHTASAALLAFRPRFELPGQEELRHGARISVWIRWVVIASCLIEVNYGAEYGSLSHVLNTLYSVASAPINGYIHYRLCKGKELTWRWMLAVAFADAVQISISVVISGGFGSSLFVVYYPALAMFAVVFASVWSSVAWTALVAGLYVVICIVVGAGLGSDVQNEKALLSRVLIMFAVVIGVNLMARFDRVRRRAAVQRERELQAERIEISQSLHDTAAQSAYMVGMGIENAMAMADGSNPELMDSLQATRAISKSMMWELRHPIDVGLVYEGGTLGHVLISHAARFTRIASIPAEVVQSGPEPPLPAATRGLLFSIAHNAMTNALHHARSTKVVIELHYGPEHLRMSITDDGTGLPDDYAERGHGFRNMETAALRAGGRLEVSPGPDGRGTTVSCALPGPPTSSVGGSAAPG